MGCGASSRKRFQQVVPHSGVPRKNDEFHNVLPHGGKLAAVIGSAEVGGEGAAGGVAADLSGSALLEKNIKLLKAAAIGDPAAVEATLARGADVNAWYDGGSMGEALGTDAEIMKSQLYQQSIGDPDYVYTISAWEPLPLEATALILASRVGHIEVVRRLLAEPGIDCNTGTKEAFNALRNNQTALHWACRQGHLGVVRLMLADERVNVNSSTDMGFTPWALAVQQGHLKVVQELMVCPRFNLAWRPSSEMILAFWRSMGADVDGMLSCDGTAAMAVLLLGGGENRLEVVRYCMQDERVRKFFFDEQSQALLPPNFRGCRLPLDFEHSPAMLALWLECGLDPNDRFDDGSTILDLAVARRLVEHVRVLLIHHAESTELSLVRRAQLLGDAFQVKQLVLGRAQRGVQQQLCTADGGEDSQQGDFVPALHWAVLQGDSEDAVAKVHAELDSIGSPEAARDLVDEGRLPASFYAVEVGHWKVARELFVRTYGFPTRLVDKMISACRLGDDAMQGQPSFRVCRALIEEGALENDETRAAAMAFLKPWCSSLVATRCLEHIEIFMEFRRVCQSKNDGFYQGVDKKVTVPMLEQAARIAADAPTRPVRQDDAGVIPPLRFYRILALRAPFSFDHEAAVAQAYALLGQGLGTVFASDVQKIFHGSSAKVVTVAPKSFPRMQNKLLNPAEHGDPNIARPRCAKNVDVLRGCVVVKTVKDLEAAYDKLQAVFKVVRVKNTHDADTDGFRGGYRSLLVNFIYKSGMTWAQLFGDAITFDLRDPMRFGRKQVTPIEENQTHLGSLWLDHVAKDNCIQKLLALQGLQVISSDQPNEPVRMIAELQLVLEPYFEGRAVSHMLFKIGRCDTGAMEMVRDFYQEYFHKEAQRDERLLAVRDIAVAAREGRRPSRRVAAQ